MPVGSDAPLTSQPDSYTKYEQDHSFTYDNGVVAIPVAGRTPKFRQIRLHGGIGKRRVTWEAQRRGKPPVIPTMEDTPYDSFLIGTVTAALPVPDPNGIGYFWRVSGDYEYVQTEPRVVGTNTIPTGTYPFPIAPNDPLGAATAAPYIGQVAAMNPQPDNPFDTLASLIGEGIVDHDSESYMWPFTVLPPTFSYNALIGA